ncbi:YfhL family 4Fe-4S dicluster ferredoxin [Serratia symbiotica]|nr:YfhL family 4Fe-4S dicluster ferredoxin [Serratia symbiotica]
MREPGCPNQAISMGDEIYQIDTERCTECIGHYNKPASQQGCPIDNTILVNPQYPEGNERLWDKFVVLHHADRL